MEVYGIKSWTLMYKHKSRKNIMEIRFLRLLEGKTKKAKKRNQVYGKNHKRERQLELLGHIYRGKIATMAIM